MGASTGSREVLTTTSPRETIRPDWYPLIRTTAGAFADRFWIMLQTSGAGRQVRAEAWSGDRRGNSLVSAMQARSIGPIRILAPRLHVTSAACGSRPNDTAT